MSMRLFRHGLIQRLILTGSDEIIGHSPLPSECTLNNVWGECHVIGANSIPFSDVMIYGVDGRVLFDNDADSVRTMDTLWDLELQKDQDVGPGIFDIDPGSSESAPMFEPGEPSIEALIDGSGQYMNKEFFKRRKMVSIISTPRGFEAGTPDSWIPGDVYKVRSSKRISTEIMSHVLLAHSNPALDDMTTTVPSSFAAENQWIQMKYLEVVLEQAWMQLIGLTETGAETPWEDAANLVEEVLEPTVIEETAGAFESLSHIVFCKMTYDITVPGRREIKQISAA